MDHTCTDYIRHFSMYAGFHPDAWWEVEPEDGEEGGGMAEETMGDML